jgi:hypothetical protein
MNNRGEVPAYPINPNEMQFTGMTIREKIAAAIKIPSLDEWTVSDIEEFGGGKFPKSNFNKDIDYHKLMATVEAKLRVIYADALLEELSKQPEK